MKMRGEKLILDLSRATPGAKIYQSFYFLHQKVADEILNTEKIVTTGKNFHVTQHVVDFCVIANLSNYMFQNACDFMIFILLYLCCVCGVWRGDVTVPFVPHFC